MANNSGNKNAPKTAGAPQDQARAAATPVPQEDSGEQGAGQEEGYVAPVVTDLAAKADPAPEVKVAQQAPAEQPKTKEATFQKPVGVIATGKMVNAKGTLATDIIVGRIETHMKYLVGALGFNTKEERQREQVSFIETVGNSLKLDYEQYVLVTDTLLNAIKANQEIFDKGLAFRFVAGLDKTYPAEYIQTYQAYIGFLAKLAKNWATRNKLGQQLDIGYVTKDFPQKAKENINQYFRQVISS